MTVLIEDKDVKIEKLSLGPWGTNSYIIVCQKTKESVLVDAPGEAGKVLEKLTGTTPKNILLTHDHHDHTGALEELRSEMKVPLATHTESSSSLSTPAEICLNDGDTVPVGNLVIEVLHTPGHTPGSLCFKVGRHLISGDTIFTGGPGKSWSPESLKQIIDSITEKIFVMPDDTLIYPGHGETTEVKTERENYADFASRPHEPGLYGDIVWRKS
ncbi:MBL fold metallo-hydrolase [Chloroflexota bacterium]